MALPSGDSKSDRAARADIYKEIKILAQVQHPNVLYLREYFEEAGKVFIVTELIKGGELLHAVSEMGNYGEADARAVFKQVLSGLSYLHARGIAHRDLKLENLLLSTEGNITEGIKIVDFGLAKRAAEGAMNTICGTPMYVAPEVVNCIAGLMYGEAVDLWSCGVILFILLSGYPPFHDESDSVLFDKIRAGKYDFDDDVWTNVTPLAKDLISKLLVLNPAARLTCTSALAHPWFSADLEKISLSAAQTRLRSMVKRKFAGAVKAVIAVNRMKHALIALGVKRRTESMVEPGTEAEQQEGAGAGDDAAGGKPRSQSVDSAFTAGLQRLESLSSDPSVLEVFGNAEAVDAGRANAASYVRFREYASDSTAKDTPPPATS